MSTGFLDSPLIAPVEVDSSSTAIAHKGSTNGHMNGHAALQRRNYGGAADDSHKIDVASSLRPSSSSVTADGAADGLTALSSHTAASVQHLRALVAVLLLLLLALGVVVYVVATRGASSAPSAVSSCNHTFATGSQGMVSTTHTLATAAGLSILKAGGNAFDAAAAVQFALNVVQPQSTGIGGGCFAVLYSATEERIVTVDGREEAPEAFSEDAFCIDKSRCDPFPSGETNYCGCRAQGAFPFRDRSTGGHPVGVPGVVRAMERMLTDYGSMKWADVLQPAIQLAENGFPMYPEMHSRLELNADRMLPWRASARLFFPNQSQPIAIGSTFTNADLARTLRDLAQYGPDFLYTGRLAAEIVAAAHQALNPNTNAESVLTVDDLSRYRAVYREPVRSSYRDGWSVAGMGGPSSGGLSVAMMLNMLELFMLHEMRPQGAEWVSRLIDAQDTVWADRALYMGDRDWVDVPEQQLMSKQYAWARAEEFMRPLQAARGSQGGGQIPYGNPYNFAAAGTARRLLQQEAARDSANPFAARFAPAPPSDKKGTTHAVVADRWGNVVSLTTTIEENFGSGVVVPNRGFLLNNELTDFTATPQDSDGRLYANRPEGGLKPRRSARDARDRSSLGGKRPMSSMSPTIVLDKESMRPVLAMGSPGGSSIIGTVLNGIVNVMDGGMCVADAVAAPRIISQNAASQAEIGWYDERYAADRSVVQRRGYEVNRLVTDRPLGFLEGLSVHSSVMYEGAADYTRLSVAAAEGY